VIAETVMAARDAAEQVEVDYEPLPAVSATLERPATAPARMESMRSNLCVDADVGDHAAVDAAFRPRRTRRAARYASKTGSPACRSKLRAALGAYDESDRALHRVCHLRRRATLPRDLAATLGVADGAVRVVARDVGGNYGHAQLPVPGDCADVLAARRLGPR